MVVAHHASARLQKEREAHPVPSLTSTQLLCLCTKSLAVTLVPMVTLSIVYVVYVPDLPDRIATSFNEEKMPTGFSSPIKHFMSMLALSIVFQLLTTMIGLSLNPVRSS